MSQIQKPERRAPEQWAVLVKEYEASGQSQRGFCAERGIGQSSLRYWRRRLQENMPGSGTTCGARLVPVSLCEERPAYAGSGLTLVARNGLRIEVLPGFDVTTLERVLATLDAVA